MIHYIKARNPSRWLPPLCMWVKTPAVSDETFSGWGNKTTPSYTRPNIQNMRTRLTPPGYLVSRCQESPRLLKLAAHGGRLKTICITINSPNPCGSIRTLFTSETACHLIFLMDHYYCGFRHTATGYTRDFLVPRATYVINGDDTYTQHTSSSSSSAKLPALSFISPHFP